MQEKVAQRLEIVRANLARAAEKSGRSLDDITIVAVTKTLPADRVVEAYRAGLTHIGENRFQEVPEKQATVRDELKDAADELTWHFIGHLQSNKARKILESFQVIQSIDRISVLEKVDRIAGEMGIRPMTLLQVNISGADTQGGVEPEDLDALADAAAACEHVQVNGLMAIGPNTDDERVIRKAFAQLRSHAEALGARKLPGITMDTLSMGMSGDYEIAVEEGATLVRLGTAIFGPRT